MVLKLFGRRKSKKPHKSRDRRNGSARAASPAAVDFQPAACEPLDNDPLKRLCQQQRYNIILREADKWRNHCEGHAILEQMKERLELQTALVPAGSVAICTTLSSQPGAPETEHDIEPYLLDVHCVSNTRFQQFVDAGGYDALEFWPEEIWPHLIELKDQTGQPAPRYWRNTRHDTRLADHPVVGVCWYEAQAFSLWVGQRLPTEPEWQMAASWHINTSTDMMRRFPWGDAMDAERCNIWASRRATTVPVTDYPSGEAPNHVRQLVGNVWEWTDSEYAITDDEERPIVGEMPMNVIRGGAFDTYFETQTTNYFRTGQIALARAHNTGFRCALNLGEACWMTGE